MGAVGLGAGLALRQRRGAGFDFVGPALPPGATLTRGTPGSCVDASGLVATRAADQPRFDRDPATRVPLGLLLEPEATNLVPASEDMVAGAGWVPGVEGYWTGSASASVGTPAGSGAALMLVANGSGAARALRKTGLSLSGTVTVSAYAFVPSQSGIANWGLRVSADNVENGDVAFAAAFNRWVRVACTIPTAGPRSFLDFYIGCNGALAAPRGFAVCLAKVQVEAGAAATSYCPADAGPATRSADVLTLDWASRGVGDGVRALRYTFDDGSSANAAATIAGGTARVPILGRPRLIRAALA